MTEATGDPVADLDQLLNQLTNRGSGPDGGDGTKATAESPEPAYSNLDAWINEYLVHVVERRVAEGATSGINWCARWWAHPEAISRLYALWRAWESLRVSDPQTGMSIWWRDHLDPHLAALTAEYGPFMRCRSDRHYDPEPLPVKPTPMEVLAQLPDPPVGG